MPLWLHQGRIQRERGLPLAPGLCLLIHSCVLSNSNKLNITIGSVYAPTQWAHVEMKDQFCDDLQAVISSAPTDDPLLMMGDFNERIGYGGDSDPSWLGVRGMFGVGRLHENGEHLLGFCAMNELCIMNTMFAKKENSSVCMVTSRNRSMVLY